MAALPKQPVSVFFGATNQDTSAKGVKLGDLLEAVNTRQVRGGEFSKRDGFTESTQDYGGATVLPDSLTSPDGMQRIIRDRDADTAYTTGSALGSNVSQGAAARIFPDWKTRFPALTTGQNVAPMAKRAGEFLVWLQSPTLFGIGKVNSVASAESGSPDDPLSLVESKTAISAFPAGLDVRSFAVIDHEDFDADHLWIFYVAKATQGYYCPGKVHALKVEHDLTNGAYYQIASYTADSDPKHCLTSISAGMVDTAAGKKLFLCACGVQCVYTGFSGLDAFRVNGAETNQGTSYTVHYFVDHTTGQPDAVGVGGHVFTATTGKQTASGCCLLSVAENFQASDAELFYAFAGTGSVTTGHDNQGIYFLNVNTATLATAASYFHQAVEHTPITPGTESAVVVDSLPPETDFYIAAWSSEKWWYLAQLTGKESTTTVDICFTLNHYYRSTGTPKVDALFRCLNPDCQTAVMIQWDRSAHTFTTAWTARGSWLAHGWLNIQRDALATGSPYVITGYEDPGALQCCYHLREWATGNIVAQFAYGEGARSGGCADRHTQCQGHYSDLNQAMLYGANTYKTDAVHFVVLLGLQSANLSGGVDVARVVLESWDATNNRPPIMQNPSGFRAVAISPGPIPTVVSGWQRLREAGPLLYPSGLSSFWGQGFG